jgi:hypothetical protein
MSWKFGSEARIDGQRANEAQLDSVLAALINQGRVKSLVLEDGRLFVDRKSMESVVYAGAVKLDLSMDPAGSYVNRDAPKPEPLVKVESVLGRTEVATEEIPMRSPFHR